MKIFLAPFLLAPLLLLTPVVAQAKPLSVVATFSILGDFAEQVGGEDVDVTTLVGPDEDAHAFKPTPKDSKALAKADLVIENGLGFEGWVSRLIKASGYMGSVVTASEGVTPHTMNEDGRNVTDPHAWQDISNARIYVRNIASAFAKALPEKADAFKAKAVAYDAKLEKLDAWVKSEIGQIPEARRKIITSHDAFGYFASAYGVSFIAPQGISTEAAPTAKQIAKLINQIKSEKIKRVFFENMTNPKLVSQLAKDAGATLGKPVYSDALSSGDGPAPTFIAMFRFNVEQFKDALMMNGD